MITRAALQCELETSVALGRICFSLGLRQSIRIAYCHCRHFREINSGQSVVLMRYYRFWKFPIFVKSSYPAAGQLSQCCQSGKPYFRADYSGQSSQEDGESHLWLLVRGCGVDTWFTLITDLVLLSPWCYLQAAGGSGPSTDRFNVNISFSKNWEHLQNKFVGTGHPDISKL